MTIDKCFISIVFVSSQFPISDFSSSKELSLKSINGIELSLCHFTSSAYFHTAYTGAVDTSSVVTVKCDGVQVECEVFCTPEIKRSML